MAQTFKLNKTNVKKIKCIANGDSYYLKKVFDTSGNVLWQETQSIPLSLTWTGTNRVESDSPPDMVATLHGLDVLTYGPAIDHSFYAKVNSGDSYALVESRINGGNTAFNFGVPDENRYYKLDITVKTSTSEEEYETTSISDELFIDYIKAEAPNVRVYIDDFFENEEVYISDIIVFPDPDIIVTECSSNITVNYDESNYYGHYRFTLKSAGPAWFKCYYPGDASRGIYDSEVATCYFTVKQACTITWDPDNTYYLGLNARFTITNMPSGTAKVAIVNASSIGSSMYNVGPATLVSSSSTSYVYDLRLSVLNSGGHVVADDAIVGCLVQFEIYFYNSNEEPIARCRATTPCAINGMIHFPDTSDLYYTRSEQMLFGDYSACTVIGTRYATDAETYSITATLNNTSLNMWEDGTRTSKTFTRRILPAYWEANQGTADNWLEIKNGVVRIRIYDYPNGVASNIGPFSGTYRLYQVGIANPVDNGGFSATPGDTGNIYFDTSVVPLPGASYYYEATVNAHGSNYAQTSVKSTSKELVSGGVHTNVGGSITYLYNYDSTSGYGARFTFTKNATRSVYVVIQRKNIANGETSYSAWREYHFMVGDGNKSWTDKATMLIKKSDGTWSVSSSAWYYKNGNSWGVEIGLDTGCQYLVTEIGADPSSSIYLLCYNASTRLAYNGSNQYAWNQSAAIGSVTSGTKYATNVGGYSCTITKSENAIWEDTMTRFDYVRSFNWGIYGNWTGGGNPKLVVGGDFSSAWTNPVTGGTYSKREVYGCIYDYPNGTMTTSKRVTGTIKLYKDGSLLLEKSFTSAPNASGNVPIPTGHTVASGSTYYALITVNEANYMTGLSNYRTDNFVHEHTWGSPTYTSDGSSTHTSREVCTKCDAVRTTSGIAHTWDGNYTYSASHGSSTHARTDHCTYCNQARTVNKEHTDDGTGYRFKYNGNKTHERANVCKYCNKRYNIVTKNCTRPSGSKKCKYCDNKTSWHA